MKKIYSFMLLAAAMLLSINAKADGAAELQAAFNHAGNGETHNVTLTENVSLGQPLRLYAKYADAGDIVNLDLNGHTIEFTGTADNGGFVLYKGTLNITGAGYIQTAADKVLNLFQIYGSPVATDANWTNLTIGEQVNVIGNKKCGISIAGYLAAYPTYIGKEDLEASYGTGNDVLNYYLNEDGSATAYNKITDRYHYNGRTDATDPLYMSGAIDYATAFKTYSGTAESKTAYKMENGTAVNKGTKLMYKVTPSTTHERAFGVNINVYGYVYGKKYGIKPNGNIISNTGNIPQINIKPSATIECAPNASSSAAVYSSGYAHVTIEGTISGSTAVYVKSGDVDINNATLTSTNNTATVPVGKSSGIEAGGSGLVVESNSAYAGGQNVTISGDTKITGAAGYAIEEVIRTSNGESKVTQINIEGGTFEAGAAGAMVYEDKTAGEGNKVTIFGANVEGQVTINGTPAASTTAVLAGLAPNTTQYHVTEVVVDDKTVVVISQGAAPTPATDSYDIQDAAQNSSVAFVSGVDYDIDEQVLEKDLVLTSLEMNANDEMSLTIKSGYTLEVGHIVMNSDAQIIVEKGAKLIVTGTQGMVAHKESNLLLQAQEGQCATFLIHPNVSSNKHPKATVEFISKAYFAGSDNYLYQRFGAPTHEALTSFTCADGSLSTPVYELELETDSWVLLGRVQEGIADKVNKPFVCYNMLSNNAFRAEGVKYTMKGELVGNGDAVLPTPITWGTYANSYMADIDMRDFYNTLPDGMTKGVYVYKQNPNANTYRWDVVDENSFLFGAEPKLAAMQGFILRRNSSAIENVTLDYASAVYNPAVNSASSAPARRAPMDVTAAMIAVSNANGAYDNVIVVEGDQFSAAEDRGYDSEKFLNEGLNLYVTADEKMAHYASDDLVNTYIGIAAKQAGIYTLSLENMIGEGLAIVDLTTGVRMDLTKGAEYSFQVDANEANDYRFQIVEAAKMPTDVEAIEAVAKKAGIYTLTGQYLGNASKWHTLPAGIYVVDGVKKVK